MSRELRKLCSGRSHVHEQLSIIQSVLRAVTHRKLS